MELAYKLMNVLDDSTENIIYDPTTINWNSYDWSQGYFVHKITYEQITKPYFISYSYYATSEYEDIILLLNNIEDVWELTPGSELWIPYLTNLKQFLAKNVKSG